MAVRTIRNSRLGKLELRLVQNDKAYMGIAFAEDRSKLAQVEGGDAEDVWRSLHDEVGKQDPLYFGFGGARARFLKFFPEGFCSTQYPCMERNYKVAAKQRLDDTAPLELAINGTGLGEAVLSAFRATNLVSPFEMMRLQEPLRGPDADSFVRAAARFALGGGELALKDMEHTLRPYGCAKWTVITYLPFLWRPEEHIFLKPEVTRDFATRVGHRFAFDYKSQLDIAVYESLLDLSEKTSHELADLSPRDGIDVQSFIWVIGDYKEEKS
jgi:hypothetical protein